MLFQTGDCDGTHHPNVSNYQREAATMGSIVCFRNLNKRKAIRLRVVARLGMSEFKAGKSYKGCLLQGFVLGDEGMTQPETGVMESVDWVTGKSKKRVKNEHHPANYAPHLLRRIQASLSGLAPSIAWRNKISPLTVISTAIGRLP